MSNDSEKWEWVDEDPIEKMLQASPSAEPTLPEKSLAPIKPSGEALIAVGRTQFEQLRFEEAAGCFSAAIAAQPDQPSAHFDLAVCLEKLEQWKAAAVSFRRTLELEYFKRRADECRTGVAERQSGAV